MNDRLTNLRNSLELRINSFVDRGESADVVDPRALAEAEELWLLTHEVDNPLKAELWNVIASLHHCRYKALPHGNSYGDLAVAWKLLSDISRDQPGSVPKVVTEQLLAERFGIGANQVDEVVLFHQLAVDLLIFALREGSSVAAELCLALAKEAAGAMPPDSPRQIKIAAILAETYRFSFVRSEKLSDINDAILYGEKIVSSGIVEDPGEFTYLFSLSRDLFVRGEITKNITDLNRAIHLGERAINAAPDNASDVVGCHVSLAGAYEARFRFSDSGDDLNKAINHNSSALDILPSGHLHGSHLRARLSRLYYQQSVRSENISSINEAIKYGRAVEEATSAENPEYWLIANMVTEMHNARFRKTGDLADIEQAISFGTKALDSGGYDSEQGAVILLALNQAYTGRYQRIGDTADLEHAIAHGEAAVNQSTIGHPAYGLIRAVVGVTYWLRGARLGSLASVDQAIHYQKEGLDSLPSDHPLRGGFLSNLGAAYRVRYRLMEDPADLDQAISYGVAAVETAALALQHGTTGGKPEQYAMACSNLGVAYRNRFRLNKSPADLDEAIRFGTLAVEEAPPHDPEIPGRLARLGLAFRARFNLSAIPDDLDDAIRYGTAAVEKSALDSVDRSAYLANLAAAYKVRFDRDGQMTDLDEAIAREEQAIASSPAQHSEDADFLFNLGSMYHARFTRTGIRADLDRAIEAWRNAASMPAAPASIRMDAAISWGSSAEEVGDSPLALEGFATAVELLPVLAWHGLSRSLREDKIADLVGLACRAAECALEVGDVERAVELCEQGRSVLWSQALQTRSDISRLRQEHPELAESLERVRIQIDSQAAGGLSEEYILDTEERQSREALAYRQRRLAEEWDELVGRIRSLDTYSSFLMPTPFSALKSAAVNGPVVLINVGVRQSHAIIITQSGARALPLSGVSEQECVGKADLLLENLHPSPAKIGDLLVSPTQLSEFLFDTLSWLWIRICRPVLHDLGYLRPSVDVIPDSLPRIWWCPTGALTIMPIHAAGDYELPAGQHISNCVVSSYTPTLGTLMRVLDRPVPQRTPSVLAIGMTTTPDLGALQFSDLPAVPIELDRIEARIANVERMETTVCGAYERNAVKADNRPPTLQNVLNELPNYPWVHFSCHGGQNFTDPSQGSLYLADGPLTVLRISSLHLPQADMAFLSACQTAVGGTRLADEAIHLAAAIQLAGYRDVIATAWSITDTYAPDIADSYYAQLVNSDPAGGINPAIALHRAVQALREQNPDRPYLWAPYLHFGP